MPLSPEGGAYAWAWGAVQAAVSARASTADVFAAVRAEAARAGQELKAGMWEAVNELRSLAATIRNGADAFQSADRSEAFTRQFAPSDINARDQADQALFPEVLVRFTLNYTDENGNEGERPLTVRINWTPDMTVGDVQDQVENLAAGLAERYGVESDGVSDLAPVSI